MIELMIMAMIFFVIALLALLVRSSKITVQQDLLSKLNEEVNNLTAERKELKRTLDNEKQELNKIQVEKKIDAAQLETLKAQVAAAADKANDMIALEVERRRGEARQKLDKEIEEMIAKSQKPILEQELAKLNADLEEARKKIVALQNAALAAQEEEDFIKVHSIELSSYDKDDIALIRSFEPKLTRKEAFRKLIWTEFIQKPIQALCKTLGVEKISGIYKITNTIDKRAYIGQAVDVATRWKEHCKTALGIGSTSFMTNKFYKAMHENGIENFTFELLEQVPREKLNESERQYIDLYNTVQHGYNSKVGG